MLLVAGAASQPAAQRAKAVPGVEDIYVARSLRLSRVAPTAFCAEQQVGFGSATFEDDHTFLAITIAADDGRLTSVKGKQIGRIHTCLGATADPMVINFFGRGNLGPTSFTGHGDCRANRVDTPEPGVTAYRCFLELADLPAGYIGGQLTTNTITSRAVTGEVSDPSGYVQPSIATVRLWKKRQ
jgi:hypothetical protein